MTVRDALIETTVRLQGSEVLRANAAADAKQLVGLATGQTYVALLAHPLRELTAYEQDALGRLTARRLRFEPVQHLRGTQEFYGRDFLVSGDVLIPRPETEDIVTAVLEHVTQRNQPLRIADVGTGSGALAITLALELPGSDVTGFDISPAALAVAQRNAERLGAAGRVRFLQSDLLSAEPQTGRFDAIVSNPPYVPREDAAGLHPEVLDWEPHLALFAEEDGLAVYRRLIPEAHARLRLGGLLLLETGGRVAEIVEWLADWHEVRVRPDLQGIARVVSAVRS